MKNSIHKFKTTCLFISFFYTSNLYSAVSSTVTINKTGFNRMGSINAVDSFGPHPTNSYSNTAGRYASALAFSISYNNYNTSSCDLTPANLTQTSSDGIATGIRIAPDIIVGLTGTATGEYTTERNSYTMKTATGIWESNGVFDKSAADTAPNYTWCGGYSNGNSQIYYKANVKYNTKFTGSWFIYVGPNAKPGTYNLDKILLTRGTFNLVSPVVLINAGNITYKNPRSCTVSTDNTITFPPVDVSDAQNNQALANKTGNFSVQCDDDSNAPVTVEIQGPKGRYSDTMALTMKDGSDAPAEIRGFIGKDIPLTGQCNGRLDGHPGVVYFIPNTGLEKMKLTTGANKYNWVLCSTGKNKTGQATGSAKLVLNWD